MNREEFELEFNDYLPRDFDEKKFHPPVCWCGENIELDDKFYMLETACGDLVLCEECFEKLEEEYDEK